MRHKRINKFIAMAFLSLFLLPVCSKKPDATEHSESHKTAEKEDLIKIRDLRMKDAVNYFALLNEGLSFNIYEKERDYLLGFVVILNEKTEPRYLSKDTVFFRPPGTELKLYSGQGSDAPLDFSIISVDFLEDEMVIELTRSLIRYNEATGKKELYYTGIIQTRITREALLIYFYEKGYDKYPLKLIGEIIKQPE